MVGIDGGKTSILKISTQDGVDCFTLKIEGKLVGDWASELERTWASLAPSLGAKKLYVDICGVLSLDDKGKRIMRGIVESTDAEILADSLLSKQFANAVKQKMRAKNREG